MSDPTWRLAGQNVALHLERDGNMLAWRCRQTGPRVVVVIDDDCMCLLGEVAHQSLRETDQGCLQGLYPVLEQCSSWDDTRAVAFFKPPGTREEMVVSLVPKLGEWIDGLGPGVNVYILLDWVFGDGTEKDEQFGPMALEVLLTHFESAKLAFLSTSVQPGSVRSKEAQLARQQLPNVPKFFKGNVQQHWQDDDSLPADLQSWLGRGHALDHLWVVSETEGWFHSSGHDEMHHIAETVFTNSLTAYVRRLELALGGVTIPKAWYETVDSFRNLHESVKRMCGLSFCGSKRGVGDKNISVGSAYLIALMTHRAAGRDLDNLTRWVPDWSAYDLSRGAIFPKQEWADARESALALFDLLNCSFGPTQDPKRSDQDCRNPVLNAEFGNSGARLTIQVRWQAHTSSLPGDESLAQLVRQEFKDLPPGRLPASSGNHDKTLPQVIRLWKAMAVSALGFMSPGVVFLRRDKIVVATTDVDCPQPPAVIIVGGQTEKPA